MYPHKFSPEMETFLAAYEANTGKPANSRIASIALNEMMSHGGTALELARRLADDSVVVGYWTDDKLGMSGLIRSGDDFIVRVDPTDSIHNYQDIDLFIPTHGAVLAKGRCYVGNLLVDSDVNGVMTYYRIAGINPMAVMNKLIRQARLFGLYGSAA